MTKTTNGITQDDLVLCDHNYDNGQFSATFRIAGETRNRYLELPALAVIRCGEAAGLIQVGKVSERPGREPYYLRQHAEITTYRRNPMTGEDEAVTLTLPVDFAASQVAEEFPEKVVKIANRDYPEYVCHDFPAAFAVTVHENITV